MTNVRAPFRAAARACVVALVIASALYGPLASSGAATPGTVSRAAVAASGAAEVQRYLNSWAGNGAITASRTYLVRSQWVLKGQRQIKLARGSVTKFELYKWTSMREFKLLVNVRMTFSGWCGSWNRGDSDRFVDLSWNSTLRRYRLEFATSPW
jgi:hypothetical protein